MIRLISIVFVCCTVFGSTVAMATQQALSVEPPPDRPASGIEESHRWIFEATIADLHRAIGDGRLTCVQLTRFYVDRIAELDRSTGLYSVIVVHPKALERAAALDREFAETKTLRALHGIPIIVKDNFDTFDLPTTAGSSALAGSVPPDDAYQVRRLRDAGAVILGKSNMAEFAFSPHETVSSILGVTRNPYDLKRVPAGSSGGTAAAVAANLATAGLGTDTGNSIRGPSSHCALVGIRSTIGLTSRDGIVPLFLGQDVGGPMARCVTDAARILEVVAGFDRADPVTYLAIGVDTSDYTSTLTKDGLQDTRIGIVRSMFEVDRTDPQVVALMNNAIADLERLGATVVDFTVPRFERQRGGRRGGFRFDLNNYLATRGPGAPVKTLQEIVDSGKYHASVARRLRGGLRSPLPTSPSEEPLPGVEGNPARMMFRAAMVAAMDEQRLDVLVYPTWRYAPRRVGDHDSPAGDNSQRLAPLSGMPAITVPMGCTYARLPAGLQLLARPFDEARLLRLAFAYEQGTRHRRAPSRFDPRSVRF